ncbi:MAG: cytochrome b/b6 domain-containing protein [Magnetococcales bacterium]|nr:cytochrome b/b6 domain-containing protein [Magnetococcales bacterium]
MLQNSKSTPDLDKKVATQTITIWDLPTRLFHWILVALVIAAFITAKEAMIERHSILGQSILALIIYRIVWGFIGGSTARFSQFIKGPRDVFSYIASLFGSFRNKEEKPHHVGHNPAGGLMILILLTTLLIQSGLGLFTKEDTFLYFDAPLAHLLESSMSNNITEIHQFLSSVILLLIAVHIVAALSYLLIFRDNLIRPMITGKKRFLEQQVSQQELPYSGNKWLAILSIGLAIGLVQGVIWFFKQ